MSHLRSFQLLEDLLPMGSAKAVLLRWNGKEYVAGSEQIEVYDFVGGHGCKHDRGYAFLSPESNRWEVACGLYEQVAGWMPD